MCGPLVMLLAKHPHRWWYFVGRTLSFAAAGLVSAEMGMALFSFLSYAHLSAIFTLFFGAWITLMGVTLSFKISLPKMTWLVKRSAKLSATLAKTLSRNSPHAVFLFGACTILLPCGQTVIVFSVIALYCSPFMGLVQGFLFALFTSPSLIGALQSSQFFLRKRKGYQWKMGVAVILVGSLALFRGFAEMNIIQHFILNPSSPSQYHIVLF
jgi:uncharacterized protein